MDGGTDVDCVAGSAREINNQARLASVYTSETESCKKNMAEEVLVDAKMEHVACQEMDVCNDFELGTCAGREERDVVTNITKTDYSVAAETTQISYNTELLQSSLTINARDVADLAKSKPCSETQVQGAMGCTGVPISSLPEPFCESKNIEESDCVKSPVKESLNSEKPDPNELLNASAMEPGAENHVIRVLDSGDLEHCSITIEKEAANGFMSNHCPKDKVEETSNDDVYSEVSNPNPSPKHLTSSLTCSSQPLDVLASDPGGCGEITSARFQTSSADGNSCKEMHVKKYNSESVSTSCVAIEIPKNISTTGIRKITFKFSKRKEDYDSKISFPGKSMVNNEIQEDNNGIHSCLSAAQPSTCTDSHKWSLNTHETIDGNEYGDTPCPFSCAPNREIKMSKKIIPDNYPTNVKKLLSTKILEGARVKYVSISGKKEIPGIIKDCGYLCGCCLCNFSKLVSAYEFELHAGTKTRHPNNHIYLENGKPVYSIIEELRTASLSALDEMLKAVAGSSLNEEYFQVWKANLQYGNTVSCGDGPYLSKPFCQNDFINSQPIEDGPCSASGNYHHVVPVNQQSYTEAPVEQKRLIKKPRNNQSFSVWEKKKATKGGSKKRDNDLHKLLFMPNGLPDGTDLAYYAKGKRILGGYKQGNGIICSCCNTELSPSQFEAHAGWSAKRQPYRHIYTSSGLTLHDIALMLANGQSLVTSGSDDMCAVCGDGGKLIICNGCPRAFHTACLGLQSLPGDDWHCNFCTDKVGPGSKTSRESKPIILRLTRVVKAPELETGGCVVCRSQDFSAVKFDDMTVILCDQCEKEYHVGCLRELGMCDLKELPKDKWFCCDDCDKIFSRLQLLASSGPEVIPTSVSAVIFRKHAAVGLNNIALQWHILSGKSRQPEHLLLLSQAAAIFRECFDPIVAKSGRDLIPVMVYGRNIAGQEFSGMYCVVLIVNSVVISAALLRIFGREAAELPLVATSKNNQGKGFFQALFSCIEGFLYSMNVKHIVLPAAEEAEPMWTKKLGFTRTSQEQMLKYTRDLQLTIFKGASLLEKEVKEQKGTS
ncbi:uncharacterized protein [Primulina huaijiensis]|uniref:uncharacterized protein n=1 Tax=Primulina huaijiensis TaxID=1492673 RepID=UPI003CC77360